MSTERVALYIRVSTEEQAREGHSLKTQREFLENNANFSGKVRRKSAVEKH